MATEHTGGEVPRQGVRSNKSTANSKLKTGISCFLVQLIPHQFPYTLLIYVLSLDSLGLSGQPHLVPTQSNLDADTLHTAMVFDILLHLFNKE